MGTNEKYVSIVLFNKLKKNSLSRFRNEMKCVMRIIIQRHIEFRAQWFEPKTCVCL